MRYITESSAVSFCVSTTHGMFTQAATLVIQIALSTHPEALHSEEHPDRPGAILKQDSPVQSCTAAACKVAYERQHAQRNAVLTCPLGLIVRTAVRQPAHHPD
jgi:hypothetical protein